MSVLRRLESARLLLLLLYCTYEQARLFFYIGRSSHFILGHMTFFEWKDFFSRRRRRRRIEYPVRHNNSNEGKEQSRKLSFPKWTLDEERSLFLKSSRRFFPEMIIT